MITYEEAKGIFSQFGVYYNTGNKKLIKHYSLKKLKDTLHYFDSDKGHKYYQSIEKRIKEVESINTIMRNTIISVVVIVVGGLLLVYLKGCFNLGK